MVETMVYFVLIELPDTQQPQTWEIIGPAMQEIGFAVPEPVPKWSGNTHAFYKGVFEGSFDEVRGHVIALLSKKSLQCAGERFAKDVAGHKVWRKRRCGHFHAVE